MADARGLTIHHATLGNAIPPRAALDAAEAVGLFASPTLSHGCKGQDPATGPNNATTTGVCAPVLANAIDSGAVENLDPPVVLRDPEPGYPGVGRVAADRDQVRLLVKRQPGDQVGGPCLWDAKKVTIWADRTEIGLHGEHTGAELGLVGDPDEEAQGERWPRVQQ